MFATLTLPTNEAISGNLSIAHTSTPLALETVYLHALRLLLVRTMAVSSSTASAVFLRACVPRYAPGTRKSTSTEFTVFVNETYKVLSTKATGLAVSLFLRELDLI